MSQFYNQPSTVQYYGKAVFISTGDYTTDAAAPSGLSIGQLSRIQALGMQIEYPLDQPTYLNGAYDSYLKEPAGVSVNLSYLHTNGYNEYLLGLAQLMGSGVMFWNLEAQKNMYITTENTPGVDAVGATGYGETKTVIGLGQGMMTQYSLAASVGGMIEAQASLSFLTSFIYSGQSGQPIPAVNYQDGSQLATKFTLPPASSQYVTNEPAGYLSTGTTNYTSALSANEMVLTFPQSTPFGVVLTGANSCFVQSFSCTLGFQRQDLKPIGYAYPPTRPVVYPIHIDLTTDVIVSAYVADQLQRISCLGSGQWVNLIVKQPCSNATLFGFYFNNLQLVSQDFVSSIGRNDVVSVKWRGILSNPYQSSFDPTVNYIVQVSDTGAWGTHW